MSRRMREALTLRSPLASRFGFRCIRFHCNQGTLPDRVLSCIGLSLVLELAYTSAVRAEHTINVTSGTLHSIQATLSDAVSLEDFTGDTDDVSLQKAINSLSSGVVHIPPGKYTFAR